MSTNVAIYCRLSEDRHGDNLGVERQEEECRAYAAGKGWNVTAVYVDNDISATTGKERPAFNALLASNPEAIVVWHTDRLIRLTVDLERVINLGVNVYALHAGHLDLSNPAGRAVARTVTAWATYEGEQKSLRQKASHKQRAKQGRPWWPSRPFGFHMDASHNEEEAEALRGIYADTLNGVSLTKSARKLNAMGLLTPKGNEWRSQSIKPILLNARNAGIYVYKGEEIGHASWEPIVSEEVYRAAVRILSSPDRKNNGYYGFGKRENLLTGIATCVKCGATVKAGYRRRNGERHYRVYECSGCHGTTLPADWCDSRLLLELLKRANQWGDMLPKSDSAQIAALKIQEEELLEQKSSLDAMAKINPEAVASLIDSIDAQLSDIADRIATEGEKGGGNEWASDIEALTEWATSDDETINVDRLTPIVRRLVERITLTGPGKGRGIRDLEAGVHLRVDWLPMA